MAWCFYRQLATVEALRVEDYYLVRALDDPALVEAVPRERFGREYALLPHLNANERHDIVEAQTVLAPLEGC